MLSFWDAIIGIFANFLSIFGLHIDAKKISSLFKTKKIFVISGIIIVFIIVLSLVIQKRLSITVTYVTLDEYAFLMRPGDSKALTATVLYSDNSVSNNVLWTSSNPSVAAINANGQITALAKGTTTITAQATRNNSTANAECVITVKTPPSGYSISVRQISAGSCYAYVYIKPYDDDVTKIQIYGKSPSGEIFTPDKDANDLYHLYAECGTWTIYASLENDAGIYEAHEPEDFATITITDLSSDLFNSFDMLEQLIMP